MIAQTEEQSTRSFSHFIVRDDVSKLVRDAADEFQYWISPLSAIYNDTVGVQ